jgi:glycolate oxidase
MALKRNAYKALESIVGQENISEDPSSLLGYAYAGLSIDPKLGGFTPFGPEAVVLPGSTEEVQGIIKVCNRYKVKYKAHSTGYGAHAMPGVENVVMVDLRRMNRIIDIDDKNMYAVIEPYVTAGQLAAEAMKKGLFTHIVGAGPAHSPLASATSFQGIGTTGITTSTNHRNLFGAEWVLPTGEILRLGSPGSGAGWFSGDGPGPSLRGIMRGFSGAMGGLGIFTRIGYKLYPWPGPDKLKITGSHPELGMETPENFKYYYPYWESWEDMTEATYKIHEEGVAYTLNRVPADWMGWYLTATNTEFYRLYTEEALPIMRKHRMGWNVTIAARKKRVFDYKKKAFEKIVEDTGGKLLALSPEHESILLLAQILSCYIPRMFRPTKMGGGFLSFSQMESVGLLKDIIQREEECLSEHVKPGGKLMEFGPEAVWGWAVEGRNLWTESICFSHRDDPDGAKARLKYSSKCRDFYKGGVSIDQRPLMGPVADMFGPQLGNVQEWIRKIKNTFDPENSSDHSCYISPEPPKEPLKPPADD